MMRMPFGKYRGCYISSLPNDYLRWLLALRDLREPLARAIREEAASRCGGPDDTDESEDPFRSIIPEPEVLSLADRIIRTGYKRLASQMHPDTGGSHDGMILLNIANHFLRSQLRGLNQ
ncbi:MAG: DUF3820 family protein [Acidobacteria bacterium]|nr:DUF3820 family protein [Acidobacteriota bacterium]